MNVILKSEFPLTDEACIASTGKPIQEWIAYLESNPDLAAKRRDAIQDLYNLQGRGKDVWWPTTLFVEYERKHGIVKKDGLLEGYNICATKTIAAPIEKVFAAFKGDQTKDWYGTVSSAAPFHDESGNVAELIRDRENKDLRYRWQTAGIDNETTLDILFSDKGNGKTGIIANHARMQTREEADGLRDAWLSAFDRLKSLVEK